IGLIIACGLSYGVIGALLAVLSTAVLACFLWFAGLLRLLQLRWPDLGHVAWRTIVAALAMAAGVRVLAAIWPAPHTIPLLALQTGALCLLGAVIYISVQLSLWAAFELGSRPERCAIGLFRA